MLDNLTDDELDDTATALIRHAHRELSARTHASLALEVVCLRLSSDALVERLSGLLATLGPGTAEAGAKGVIDSVLDYIERDRQRIAVALGLDL